MTTTIVVSLPRHTIEAMDTALQTREVTPSQPVSYYRARYYDPAAGRFLREDPLTFDGGINFYAYVTNQPILLTDPLDLSGCPANVSGYIKQMCSAAKAASGPNCPCHIILIQSGFESAWGTGPTVPDNNFLGLHGVGDKGWRPANKDPKVKLPIFSNAAAGSSALLHQEHPTRTERKSLHHECGWRSGVRGGLTERENSRNFTERAGKKTIDRD